jgi:hypothetical protein
MIKLILYDKIMGNTKYNEPTSLEEMEEKADPKIDGDAKLKSIDFLKKKGILIGDSTSWKVKFDDGREFDIVDLMAEFTLVK